MDKFRDGKKYEEREKPYVDPVLAQSERDKESPKKTKMGKMESEKSVHLTPSLSKRVELTTHEYGVEPGTKYVPPKSKKQKKKYKERRRKYEEELKFCQYDVLKMPTPKAITNLEIMMEAPSADIKEAKVFPRKASITPSELYPEPPTSKDLSRRQPRSGTIINETTRRRKAKKKKKPEMLQRMTIEELLAQELVAIEEIAEGGEETLAPLISENYLTKQFRRKVSQLSKSTSIKSRDFRPPEEQEEGEEEEPIEKHHFIDAVVQKFRRESEIKRYQRPRRRTKKGTFENFSFTRLKQPTLKTFYYGVKMGTINQKDQHFPILSRGKQGICVPIAAYCFSILKHPDRWTQADIDDILEAGNELFLESVDTQHLHGDNVELKISDLRKYCKIGKRKLRFVVSEPQISGMVRSDDPTIYNLTKGVNLFFRRFSSGILQTEDLSVAIWKDKHFYFFDAGPRTIDLFSHPNGTALMANFYDTASLITVLLNRSNLENIPFIIYSIQAHKILLRDAEEVDSTQVVPEADNFQVLDEEKAVAVGSFDLADKCFGFSRNKQALAIAVVALVYSKITVPSSWHKGTIDKIIIIGNQLFLECIENDAIEEVNVDDLPAVFTIGPYVVEICVVPNKFVDFMFKKSRCVLGERLEKFFETSSNAVIRIDSWTIAVWKQRNIYHCFDPYSRNREGLRCRDGTACVSMHTTLSSLISTISANFDQKEMIFHIHAMKVCKIHRDPSTKELFPKCLTMNEYPVENFKKIKMKKGRRKATAKYVTVDPDTKASFYGQLPDDSILEVGSTVRSIGMEDLPPMVRKVPLKLPAEITPPAEDYVADLDSPSLSDTQIEPSPPEQPEGEYEIEFMDLDSFQLTEEEKEMTQRGEGEGAEGKARRKKRSLDEEEEEEEGGGEEDVGEDEKGEGEGDDQWYMAASEYTQIGSQSLLSSMSAQVGTEPVNIEIPDEEVPAVPRNIKAIARQKRPEDHNIYESDLSPEPDVTLSEELAKETNFMALPDGSQIVLGGTNMAAFGSELEFMAPFVCIMAAAVARKYAIDSWSKDVVDYVLKCGAELYDRSNTRYDQNYKLEISKISLGKTDFSIRVNYLFDSYIKPKVLQMAICNILFPKWSSGIIVTPTYSCAIFYKNHLYYLYDGFGNNEVGLSRGSSDEGIACLARFQDVPSLVARIIHNKEKREEEENIEYNRFVLSYCYVKKVPKEIEDDQQQEETAYVDETQQGEDDDHVEEVEIKSYKKKKKKKKKEEEDEEEQKPPPKMGYRLVDNLYKIEGTKALGGADEPSEVLKEDYFACLCACLLLLNNPLSRWDARKVDSALDQGVHVYGHADDLEVCSKKFIKNVLVEDYVFDVKASRVKFATHEQRRTLQSGIETMLSRKHQTFILQFANRSYAVHVDADAYNLFDPGDPSGRASWTRYTRRHKLSQRLKSGASRGCESYNFHCFEITSITRAPKHVVVGNRAKKYRMLKGRKGELVGKPFYEEISWLERDPIPWSWRTNKGDLPAWHSWYIDIPDDLFSLYGSLSPVDEQFPAETRRKQSLGNLIVALGMTQIYELKDWNIHVMDSIVANGDAYFRECIKDISDENYEVAFEDVTKECTIFPYSFRVKFTPVVEGTMFLVRLKQFNLYKALRLFFDDYERRHGIISVRKGDADKRVYAFGKLQESEYFFYDCETLGPPMYVEKDSGVPYILRATTLNRLLHVMTLTMRGGDFFMFELGLSELKSVA